MSRKSNLFAGVLPLAVFVSVAAGQSPGSVAPLRTARSTDIAAGKRIFESQCAWCHGTNGAGGTGPSLQRTTLRHAANDNTLADIVRNGIPGTEMPGFTVLHRRQREAAGRGIMGRGARDRREDRESGVGFQAADAAVGRGDGDRRRTRVRRIERRQLLGGGREERQAAVAIPDGRCDPLRAHVIPVGGKTARGGLG